MASAQYLASWAAVLSLAAVAAVAVCMRMNRALAALTTREELLYAKSFNTLVSMANSNRSSTGGKAPPVAVITGANSGIGFALARTLVLAGFEVVLACRDDSRGHAALASLHLLSASCPGLQDRVHVMRVDVASLASVQSFCAAFKSRFKRLDFLFCNAGSMQLRGYGWGSLLRAVLTCRLMAFLETGRPHKNARHFLVQHASQPTEDGVDSVFATHVLGHFAMCTWLSELLVGSHGRIVWTGSRAATAAALCVPGVTPAPALPMDAYASAKTAQDLVSFALDQRMRVVGVRSSIVCPGFVDTDVSPPFFRKFRAVLGGLRTVLHSFQVTPERGSAILLHVAAAQPKELAAATKYVLRAGRVGRAVNGATEPDPYLAEQLYQHCSAVMASYIEQHVRA